MIKIKKMNRSFVMTAKLMTMTLLVTVFLTACGDSTKERLGLSRQSPDEFTVVKRAPLSVPPDFTLRPPEPGAPRPQEQSAQALARQTIMGERDTSEERDYTEAERALLGRAGALDTDAAIRRQVDQETDILTEQRRPVVEKLGLMDGVSRDLELLDPAAEAERLTRDGAAERVIQPAPTADTTHGAQ